MNQCEMTFAEINEGDIFWVDGLQYRKVPHSQTPDENFNAVLTENGRTAPLLRLLKDSEVVSLVERYSTGASRRQDEVIGRSGHLSHNPTDNSM